jgi:hypothetical protein
VALHPAIAPVLARDDSGRAANRAAVAA